MGAPAVPSSVTWYWPEPSGFDDADVAVADEDEAVRRGGGGRDEACGAGGRKGAEPRESASIASTTRSECQSGPPRRLERQLAVRRLVEQQAHLVLRDVRRAQVANGRTLAC